MKEIFDINPNSEYIGVQEKGFPLKIKEHVNNTHGIYYKGDITLLDTPSIAIVGSRICTAYGKVIATELGRRAAAYGVTVVSGLAKGVDAAGHRGALDGGGKTIAVIGNGLDKYYPGENRKLQDEITKKGLIISEYPPGTKANSWHFPMRNRIISGLADAIIIVEAGTRSGSLITAECGAEQGKEVYAVPGNITSQGSLGTNKLIFDGAKPLIYVDQVFHDLIKSGIIKNPMMDISEITEGINLSEGEKRVVSAVSKCGEISLETLSAQEKIPIGELNGIVSVLEIKGILFSDMGKVMIAKCSQVM